MQIAAKFLAKMFNEQRTEDKKPAWPNIFRLTKPNQIETSQTKKWTNGN